MFRTLFRERRNYYSYRTAVLRLQRRFRVSANMLRGVPERAFGPCIGPWTENRKLRDWTAPELLRDGRNKKAIQNQKYKSVGRAGA
eukprot:scaffold149_cov315-Pinguiococcus_pyrenoidosus.AAC.36